VYGTVFDHDDGARLEGLEPVLRAPRCGELGQIAHRVESLPEVALSVEQGDPGDRQAQVRGGPQQVPGKHAQPAPAQVGIADSRPISIEKYATRICGT
jgi:hypothetical protein